MMNASVDVALSKAAVPRAIKKALAAIIIVSIGTVTPSTTQWNGRMKGEDEE